LGSRATQLRALNNAWHARLRRVQEKMDLKYHRLFSYFLDMYRDSLRSMDNALELFQDSMINNGRSDVEETTRERGSAQTTALNGCGSGSASHVNLTASERTAVLTSANITSRLNGDGGVSSTNIAEHTHVCESSATETAARQKRCRPRVRVDDAIHKQTKRARLEGASSSACHESDEETASSADDSVQHEHVCKHRCSGTPPSTPPHYWDLSIGKGTFLKEQCADW